MLQSLVSVVVPVYNNETTIAETIESVIAQTYPNWELFCVDDGSTDNSEKIIKDYCLKDNRVHLISRKANPKGGSSCRNIGAYSANGDFLIFLDGDDLLTETCIENRLKMIASSNLDFAVFPMASFMTERSDAKKCSMTFVKDMKYFFASAQAGWQVSSPIFRTSFFTSINGFDTRFPRMQDLELHLRAILASGGNYIVFDDANPDCLYRVFANHYSGNKMVKVLEAHKLFFQLLKENKNEFNDKKKFSIALLNNYCSVFYALHNVHHDGLEAITFEQINDPDVYNIMLGRHKFLVSLFKKSYLSWLGLFIVKATRKVMLRKFIR